jgi:hypothetical protein
MFSIDYGLSEIDLASLRDTKGYLTKWLTLVVPFEVPTLRFSASLLWINATSVLWLPVDEVEVCLPAEIALKFWLFRVLILKGCCVSTSAFW